MIAKVHVCEVFDYDPEAREATGEGDAICVPLLGQARVLAETAASHGRCAHIYQVRVEGSPREVVAHLVQHQLSQALDTVEVTWVLRETYVPTDEMTFPVDGAWQYEVREADGWDEEED